MDNFGHPYNDYFKEILVEKILIEVENEVYWELLWFTKDEKPTLTRVFDEKTGLSKGFKHAPNCRCKMCPFNDFDYIQTLKNRKLSPFHKWKIDPSEFYIGTGTSIVNPKSAATTLPNKHTWFCKCSKCLKKPICKLIAVSKQVGRIKLLESSIKSADLEENYPGYKNSEFDINIWKMGLVQWTIEAIQKRKCCPWLPKMTILSENSLEEWLIKLPSSSENSEDEWLSKLSISSENSPISNENLQISSENSEEKWKSNLQISNENSEEEWKSNLQISNENSVQEWLSKSPVSIKNDEQKVIKLNRCQKFHFTTKK